MRTTQEVVPEPKVSTKAEPTCPGEPSSLIIDIQEPLVPSGEDILETTLKEMVSPNEPYLNEQQAGDMEIKSADPIPEQVCDEPEKSARLAEPTGVEPMEVEGEPQRVQ